MESGDVDKRTTIYDIAARLGISTATVNRALTGKPYVKDETRELVLKTAAEMGFKPNALARSLARRKLRLAVVGFTNFTEFHGQFLNGAREAGEALQDFNVSVDYFSYDHNASETMQETDGILESMLQHVVDGGYDGALVLARSARTFQTLRDRGIVVGTAVNDIDEGLRRFHVCYNGFVAGRIAAEMIYHWMPDASRPVAVASGWANQQIHNTTVRGFQEQARRMPLNIRSVYYNQEDTQIAYESTCRLLETCPELGAIYVNSFNSSGVIRAVLEHGLGGRVVLVTSDLNAELREHIASGVVAASIFQNQYEQGRIGLHTLYNVLANDGEVSNVVAIDPRVIISSNLELF